jgi:predicted transcriptional regulator
MNSDLLAQASTIVEAYVSNNRVSPNDIASVLKDVHATLRSLANGAGETPATAQKPAVPIKRSIHPNYIVCLEDGKKLKMLKRYLRSRHGLTPEGYRTKWGLPLDYPMTAPNYAELRSQFAKKIGLGKRKVPVKKRRRG